MATYKPLQTTTLTADSASLTFSGIDQNYTDLILIASAKAVAAGDDLGIRFNGDSSSVYSYVFLTGDGSSATRRVGSSQSGIICDYNGSVRTSEYTVHTINIPSYTSTINYKSVLIRANSSTGVDASVQLWRGTPQAITSMTLYLTAGNTFSAGSTFSLYGIKAGAPQAIGGDLVTTDGNYWYHTFRSTQTFTPLRALSVDYLVVAGGGGAGTGGGGGGGAGGYLTSIGSSTLSVSPQTYAVTVGAGGAFAIGTSNSGSTGNNSVFASITSTGGGGGGGRGGTSPGLNGGSGGGEGCSITGKGLGTAGQGNNGGAFGGGSDSGGGGGGAGAVGENSSTRGGNGGNGLANSISGSSVTYAGGGGGGCSNGGGAGGTGGTGGGGTGGTASNGTGTNATANTGGGGGGGGLSGSAGGNGGSGVVIVRYAV